MYEIEHRAVFTENEYDELRNKLESGATFLGQDDKEVGYYIFPDKLLKVVKNISHGTAKLSLKFNTLGGGSAFEELEVSFPQESFAAVERICESISSPSQIIHGTQKRSNYSYDGVEIALKWSEDWGYHAEFEIMVTDEKEKDAADAQIRKAAESLNVRLMSEAEVAEFSAAVRAKKK